MISLTPQQAALCRFLVRERAQGRMPNMAAAGRALGLRSSSGSFRLRASLESRVLPEEIETLVPRAPDGAPLRIVPVKGLPLPWELD